MIDYAQLAQSLRDNEAFQAALDNQRNTALERLATMPRGDEAGFYMAQSVIAVVDAIRADLDQFIRAGAPKRAIGLPGADT